MTTPSNNLQIAQARAVARVRALRIGLLALHKTSRAWNLPAKSLRWANAQLVGARGSAFSASLPEVLTRNI